MKFLTNKIELICSTDTARPDLCAPYLDLSDPAKPYLVATDGPRLIALALTAAELNDGLHNKDEPQQWTDISGPIPLDAIKAARKLKSWIDASKPDTVRVIGGATYPREMGLQFPDWRQVCPSPDRPELSAYFTVKYLKDAATVLEDDAPEIRFSAASQLDPLRVIGAHSSHIAVIMPIRAGGDESPARNGTVIKSANERAAITPDDLENENTELKDRLSELKTELEEKTKECIALEEDDSCCKETRTEVETEQQILIDDAESAAAVKLEQARKYLKTWPPPRWCDVCDTASFRHAADCLVLSVLQ